MNPSSFERLIALETLQRVAAALASALTASGQAQMWISLEGPLGAGKTTFMRALLVALGVSDRIKSPTYTLVETYQVDHQAVQHWDWYRLHDPTELEVLGFEEGVESAWVFVEWSSRFPSLSKRNDVLIEWVSLEEPRRVRLTALTERGLRVLAPLNEQD